MRIVSVPYRFDVRVFGVRATLDRDCISGVCEVETLLVESCLVRLSSELVRYSECPAQARRDYTGDDVVATA